MLFIYFPVITWFVPLGGVPPVPDPGEADQLLPLSGHLSDRLQPPGLS